MLNSDRPPLARPQAPPPFRPPGATPAAPAAPAVKPPAPPPSAKDEPIALEPENFAAPSNANRGVAVAAGAAPSAVRAIKTTLDLGQRKQFKRQTVNTGTGAIRCRLFHCKVAESSMEHMENQINIWLDEEDIDIKHIGHVVGTMEGKHAEPNLIVMVWF